MGLLSVPKSVMSAMHGPIYRHRLGALVGAIVPHLKEGDEVIDIGCGNGTLGEAIMADPACPKGVRVRGLERFPRGGEPIEVVPYDGTRMPLDDGSVDVAIVADVLHHEQNPDHLAAECARVASRYLIVKDHRISGPLAQQRISFIDWAANAPYGVPCLYRYNTPAGWAEFHQKLGMEPVEVRQGMNVYPPLFEQAFGGGLHYFAVLEHAGDRARGGSVPSEPGGGEHG